MSLNPFHLSVPDLNMKTSREVFLPKKEIIQDMVARHSNVAESIFTCLLSDQHSLANDHQAYQCRQNHFTCLSSIRADLPVNIQLEKRVRVTVGFKFRNLTFVSCQMSNSAFSSLKLTNDETKRTRHYKESPQHDSSSVPPIDRFHVSLIY